VWEIIAHAIGAMNIPRSFNQCWNWCECELWLPDGAKFHTLGIVTICWAIWKTRNAVCFKGKTVVNPVAIICYAYSLMGYSAGLFLENDKERLLESVKIMLAIATKLVAKRKQDQC
jgi:hypothetical protein